MAMRGKLMIPDTMVDITPASAVPNRATVRPKKRLRAAWEVITKGVIIIGEDELL